MSKSNFQKVCEFNLCAGHPCNSSNRPELLNDKKTILLRLNLILEELKETKQAFIEKDYVEVIDGLADILYVVFGMATVLGIKMDTSCWNHNLEEFNDEALNTSQNSEWSQQNKFLFSCEKTTWNKVMSDEKTMFKTYEKIVNLFAIYAKLEQYTQVLTPESIFRSYCNVTNTLCKLAFYVHELGYYLNTDLDDAFEKVHDSNMSKFCNNEELALETVEWYKLNEKRYEDPFYRKSNDDKHWVIFDQKTGKILKSIKYTPVDLTNVRQLN
jgi:NTP pyrophosphatase (non-canonical NTP hydrolase)